MVVEKVRQGVVVEALTQADVQRAARVVVKVVARVEEQAAKDEV